MAGNHFASRQRSATVGLKNDESGTSRRSLVDAIWTMASRASSRGAPSPIGDAVAKLPPSVARFRIGGDAQPRNPLRETVGCRLPVT